MGIKEDLQQNIKEARSMLAKLEDWPEEPDEASVVYVRMRFNAPRCYTYAAVKSNDKWYMTGSWVARHWPNGCSWEQLMSWVCKWEYEMWAATEYECIGGSL